MKTAIVIGAGHNGLVAAYYLARGGFAPIVLERRDQVGGGAIAGEFHPGFSGPLLSHEARLEEQIVRDLQLERHGAQLVRGEPGVCGLSPATQPLLLGNASPTEHEPQGIDARDVEAYRGFRRAAARVARVLAATFTAPPPDIDRPGAGDLLNLLKAGTRFRQLGRRDGYRLLRWVSMPVADLMHEWFEGDLVRATLAAPALSGTMLGPRSAGSAMVLLMREAHQQLSGPAYVLGGPGALTRALAAAARAAGADIRTGARVDRILVADGRVRGVVSNGKELPAGILVSAADPKTTFLSLLNATDLAPEFARKVRNYRASGTVAKINLALAGLPRFGVDERALTGRVYIAPELDYLERAFDHAKYGEMSAAPWLDMTIPSIRHAGLAPSGAHVASIYVHYAPRTLREGDWNLAREAVLARTLDVIESCAPGFRSQIVSAQVITPEELEREYGFYGGHIFHGELALDQIFTMRPFLGMSRYRTPIAGLYLCGAGTHPGGFMSGTSGRLAAREILANGAR